MKAVVAKGYGAIEVVDMPAPELAEYECLVRVRACGFCSTDIKIIEDHISNLKVDYPVVLGHEGVGEVIETGAKVRNIRKGDVFCNPHGRLPENVPYRKMWANMIEYAVVQDHQVMEELGVPRAKRVGHGYPVPQDIEPADAGMLLALTEAYSGVINFGIGSDTDLLIFGDGPIALALASFARLRGAKWIGCAGHHDDRLRRFGELVSANALINTKKEEVEACLGDRRLDVAVDAVGSSKIIRQAGKLLKPGGKVGVYGVLPAHDANFNLLDVGNNTSIHMLNWPHNAAATYDDLLEHIRAGRIDPKNYYSHVLPMDEAPRALDLIRGREAFRVILEM